MNEVIYSIEYLLRSLTWKEVAILGVVLAGVCVVCRLLKVKKDKIEETVVAGYKKIEESVVEGYKKVEDSFVEKHLVREDETVEDAKVRLKKK